MGKVICVVLGFVVGIVATLLVMAAGWLDPKTPPTKEWGEFPSSPKVELLGDGRLVRLLEDFVYIDPAKKAWVTRKDSVVDGASIPRVFWSLVGGPFEGQFRNASIVHDEACDRRTEPPDAVHLMFYQACRCGGLSENKAKVMYAAVYHFGPRWELRTVSETRLVIDPDGKRHTVAVTRTIGEELFMAREVDEEVRAKLEKYVNEKNPSLEELKKVDPKGL